MGADSVHVVTTTPGDGLVYPNPGSSKIWTAGNGRAWQRRGDTHVGVDEKRMRTLLRRPAVPLATWSAGIVTWADEPEAKVALAARLHEAAAHPGDVVASEWQASDGIVMLLLEHHC